MSKYLVTTKWQGYSRGTAMFEVEANSAEEAEAEYYEGVFLRSDMIRDDRESEVDSVKLMEA